MRRPAGEGYVYKRGRIWYAQYYANGKRVRFNTGVESREEAEEILRLEIAGSNENAIVGMVDTWQAGRSPTGTASELIVCADLLVRGFEVFLSVDKQSSCDVLAMRDGKIIRVEVKTAPNNQGHVSIKRQIGRFDVLAILIKGKRIIYRPELGRKPQKSPENAVEAPVVGASWGYTDWQ